MDREFKNQQPRFTNEYELPKVITSKWLDEKFNEPRSSFWIWGFSMRDISECTFAPDVKAEHLMKISFDETTRFPKQLPEGYVPSEILKKSFGTCLSLAELHQKGITGKGCKVAIIDSPIAPLHQEFSKNIEYIELAAKPLAHFHGLIVAANLVGKNVGIAPDAQLLFYSRSQMSETSDSEMVSALEDIVKRCKEGEGIRVVSLSMPYPLSKKEEYYHLVQILQEQGCTVIDSDPGFSRDFQCGRFATTEINNPEAVVLNEWQGDERYQRLTEGKVVVPSAGRIVPLWWTEDQYQYCAQGGASWSIPMLAGIFTLALQVAPKLSYDEFCKIARETATKNCNQLAVINPRSIVESLQKR